MKAEMEAARVKLLRLLEENELTSGMSVRVYGDHLILGRPERNGARGRRGIEDRVRLTRLSATRYGLSVKRHTGRWERTPFSGPMKEMVHVMLDLMQHLIAPW